MALQGIATNSQQPRGAIAPQATKAPMITGQVPQRGSLATPAPRGAMPQASQAPSTGMSIPRGAVPQGIAKSPALMPSKQSDLVNRKMQMAKRLPL